MNKYKVVYNNGTYTFDETFDNEEAAQQCAWDDAEEKIKGNLNDIIQSEVDDMYEIIEVAE